MDSHFHALLTVDIGGWAKHHRWAPGESLTRHAGMYYGLWLMLDGYVLLHSPTQTLRAERGEAVIIPRTLHGDTVAPEGAEWLSVGMAVTMPGGEDWFARHALPARWRPEAKEWQRMQGWLRELVAIDEERGAGMALVRAGLGRALLGCCLDHLGSDAAFVPGWLPPLLARLQEHPDTSLALLAADAGYSPAQFRHLFHKYVGMSPRTYAQRCRLDAAKRLLKTTDASISAIADHLHFENASHFTRFFTRTSGLTPTQFRKSAHTPGV